MCVTWQGTSKYARLSHCKAGLKVLRPDGVCRALGSPVCIPCLRHKSSAVLLPMLLLLLLPMPSLFNPCPCFDSCICDCNNCKLLLPRVTSKLS